MCKSLLRIHGGSLGVCFLEAFYRMLSLIPLRLIVFAMLSSHTPLLCCARRFLAVLGVCVVLFWAVVFGGVRGSVFVAFCCAVVLPSVRKLRYLGLTKTFSPYV